MCVECTSRPSLVGCRCTPAFAVVQMPRVSDEASFRLEAVFSRANHAQWRQRLSSGARRRPQQESLAGLVQAAHGSLLPHTEEHGIIPARSAFSFEPLCVCFSSSFLLLPSQGRFWARSTVSCLGFTKAAYIPLVIAFHLHPPRAPRLI